jgi:hypothetical protein
MAQRVRPPPARCPVVRTARSASDFIEPALGELLNHWISRNWSCRTHPCQPFAALGKRLRSPTPQGNLQEMPRWVSAGCEGFACAGHADVTACCNASRAAQRRLAHVATRGVRRAPQENNKKSNNFMNFISFLDAMWHQGAAPAGQWSLLRMPRTMSS